MKQVGLYVYEARCPPFLLCLQLRCSFAVACNCSQHVNHTPCTVLCPYDCSKQVSQTLLRCLQLHDGFTDAYYYVRKATLACVKGHMEHFAQLRAVKLNSSTKASAAVDGASKPVVRGSCYMFQPPDTTVIFEIGIAVDTAASSAAY
jgi:hypothetical protein